MHSSIHLSQCNAAIHTYVHTHTKPDQPASRSWDKLAKGQSAHKAECPQKIIGSLTCRSPSSDLADKPLAVSTQSRPETPLCPLSRAAAFLHQMLWANPTRPLINNDFATKSLFRSVHSHLLDVQLPPSRCVWLHNGEHVTLLLVETHLSQNDCEDGSQVNGIHAIFVRTVSYLTEKPGHLVDSLCRSWRCAWSDCWAWMSLLKQLRF